ncbi:MAG TPA: TetR/AcrR family transcriptional regulator [Bryobacteraceae bacterium]|nr:TetR/AcrR family transcriptional regulator [Bryobacteraceae bacterium]
MTENTKERLLETAQRLFGQQGYDATSLRHIIAEAGVNLAAIHYHFGSKEELLDEIIQRSAGPVNEQRLALLDRAEAEAGGCPLSVEKVLHAFLWPMSTAADENPEFVRLMGRIHAEGMLHTIVQRHFQAVLARFVPAMRKAVPHLSPEEFLWRMHFMIGAMAHTMCGAPDFTRVTEAPGDFSRRIEFLIRFLSGGFHAPEGAGVEVKE